MMATSPEYPDLQWVPPKAWFNANRSSVQVIVIHTTEGSEGPNSAEDGAAYDARRTDGTSTHFFHDSSSTVQCVRTEDVAYAARSQGNKRGIQHELCGRAGQGDAGWADDVSRATLWRAAAQCARDAKKWGIPIRKLSPRDVAAGAKGICGHVDITAAFPQDSGTHTDPGPTFPWADFLDMVQLGMESDMGVAEDIAAAVWGTAVGRDERRRTALELLLESRSAAQTAAAALPALAARDDVDEEVLGAAVGAALAPAVIAYLDNLPEGELTVDGVKAAVRDVLRTGVGG